MQVARFSLPAPVAAPLETVTNRSIIIRSAITAFARSKKCTPEFIAASPVLHGRHQKSGVKFSVKVEPEWLASMKKIAAKVVTDRPRGERLSRFVAAALVWQQARA